MAYVAKVTAGGQTGMLVGSTLYGECTDSASTVDKTVSISGFDTLITGVTIHVKFTNGNTASSPTLKVTNTGAKAIKMYGTTAVGNTNYTSWYNGAVVSFTYDGNYWIMNDYHRNNYVTAGKKSGTTLGTGATAEGSNTTASGNYSHAEGLTSVASGAYSHAEGRSSSTASGEASHAEGYGSTASGHYSHAEGQEATASGGFSHAEGNHTYANGMGSHAEGDHTTASMDYQHVFGKMNVPDTHCVEVVGWGTDSTQKNIRTLDTDGNMTLAGKLTLGAAPTANMDAATKQYVDAHYVTAGQKDGTTLGNYATTEGWHTEASGVCAHSEGQETIASGKASHAEGYITRAISDYSHAEGYGTKTSQVAQHVCGKYNSQFNGVEIVGNGAVAASSNARTLDWNGNEWIAGTLTQASDARLKDVQGDVPDVSDIRAVRFKWNDKKGEHDEKDHIGYLAQEVEKIAPYLVGEDSNGYKSLDYIALLCAKVEILEREVEELKQNKNV